MATLPIREMVLYKHGVGFFVRAGAVNGTAAALTFKSDEINDVLKSLTVFDQAGGQVLGIHYPTPIPAFERLATSSIKLSDRGSLRDLLVNLRGRRATMLIEPIVGTLEPVSGRVIGIDEPPPEYDHVESLEGETRVLILTGQGTRIAYLRELRGVTIDDELANSDLTYFLDTTSSDDQRRTITVQLSEGEHDLVAQYVAPSPLWRVSYRLVADVDEKGEITSALLQGWGLFDNRFEEDLDGVRLTLVAGQPISFVYDLSESQIPPRPVIKDEARVAPSPIEFDAAADVLDDEPLALGMADHITTRESIAAHKIQGLTASGDAYFARPSVSRQRDVAPAQAQGKETGETFQYQVNTPVTVKRGESALVPLFNADVNPSRELLYNGAKLRAHPIAALRFKNASGLTLERGPVTLVEGGDYKGEAIIPFTKNDSDVYVPYAVELGITITEKDDASVGSTRFMLENKFLMMQQYRHYSRTYTIENTLNKPAVILIEKGILADYPLYDTPAPDVETATERRWSVRIGAKARTTFTVKERHLESSIQQIQSWRLSQLVKYFEHHWIDEALYGKLRPILELQQTVSDARNEQKKLAEERKTIAARQEQIRANLAALQPTGQEATLRNRVLAQLEASEDRLAEIERRSSELDAIIQSNEAEMNGLIAALE